MIYIIFLLSALVVAALEALSYFGFAEVHTHVPNYAWYLLSLLSLVLIPAKLPKWFKLFLTATSLGSLIAFAALTGAELLHYPNYVYTLFHINLVGLQLFVLLIWFHYIFLLFQNQDKFIRLGVALLISSLLFTAAEGWGRDISFLGKHFATIIKYPFDSYENKLVKAYGGFYPAMELVRKYSPDNALVLIPFQGNPWEVEGNAPMVTYYLYPRKVENLSEVIPDTDKPVYALIAHGSWGRNGSRDYGWPKFAVPTTRLWRFDVDSHTAEEFTRPYNPLTDKWDWGLIEVKK